MTYWDSVSDATVNDEVTVKALAKLTTGVCRHAAASGSSNYRALAECAMKALAYELRDPSEVPRDLQAFARDVHSRVVARAKYYRKRIITRKAPERANEQS